MMKVRTTRSERVKSSSVLSEFDDRVRVNAEARRMRVSSLRFDKLSSLGRIKEVRANLLATVPISKSVDHGVKLMIKSNTKKGQYINTCSRLLSTSIRKKESFNCILTLIALIFSTSVHSHRITAFAQTSDSTPTSSGSIPATADSNQQQSSASCFGGLQTFEKISMSTFENPSSSSASSFGGGILIQQDDQALTSECVNLCRSQANCLSFVIDYNKFECKSYATTQQELQQEFDAKFQVARSVNASLSINVNDTNGYQAAASNVNFQHLLPSASSNYFEKVCLDGVAPGNHFSDVCGQGRLWTIERVVDSFLDGFVEKEVTNVNNKDECSKLCIFESQFVCRSADYDQHSRLCRLSKEDRRTQPQAMRHVPGSNRQYLENQCATPGPSSCVYETKKNFGIISMDALKFAQTVQDCQMKCNQETTFNCRSYSFHQQRCFLSGDDSSSLNSNLIKLPVKQGWQFGEKKCLVELCTKGIFSYEKITGYTLRSALSTPIDLMMMPSSNSGIRIPIVGTNLDDLEKLQHEASQTKLQQFLPMYYTRAPNSTSYSSNLVSSMMMAANNNNLLMVGASDPLQESASSIRNQRSSLSNNLAITNHCRHSCDLGYLNCPAFTIDYKNNRCQRLDRNSQGRHNELVARDGFAYYEKICLRVPEIMSMCQDKYWIFERVIGYELAPRFYDKALKFVQSRRDCEEYCLEEKQFQCRSALYNDETSDCKLSRYNRRLSSQEGGYYRNFNARISYLENQCIRDHGAEKAQQCSYEQTKDEPSYPTFTEHIEMVPASSPESPSSSSSSLEMEASGKANTTRQGPSYCEQLCNDNSKFECHSFGYYSSTAQCFLSGDDSVSVGDLATTPSSGFTYYEKKCRLNSQIGSFSTNVTTEAEDPTRNEGLIDPTSTSTSGPSVNPYFQQNFNNQTRPGHSQSDSARPSITNNNNFNIHINQRLNITRPGQKLKPTVVIPTTDQGKSTGPDQYKCGIGHTFVYQRISGFEPIGGYLTLLIKNNEQPGIVAECSDLCKKAFECRAFVVDYNNNQCFAMLENSSVGMLSLRQTLGKDYFEGFCIAEHTLITGNNCRNKTWIVDKIVDQAVIGVQHQKLIMSSDRAQCRHACLDERMFWCKSAMFDEATGDCKLYSIDRESMPQMRLLFTKGVDFFENQCQIMSSSCPYDAIERDMTIVTITRSVQARSTFDCELACNSEQSFNCRSYTFLEEYPSLPNLCLLSADSRSTSQKGSVKEHQRTLYAERNCYYRRPRYPGGSSQKPNDYSQMPPPVSFSTDSSDPYHSDNGNDMRQHSGHSSADGSSSSYSAPKRVIGDYSPAINSPNGDELNSGIMAPGQGCEAHQFTFERTFGYDFRLGQKERAPISPSIGIAIGCQQECLRRGDRCQSFVVEYALPYQSCFLIENQVGANKKLLVKSPNSAYFEKVCLPRTGLDSEQLTHAPIHGTAEMQSMDIAPSYSNEPWSPQPTANQLPYYLQQQQLSQNYPSRTCAKLWSFERFINHNFTATSDKILDEISNKVQCETACLNEASFNCRAATYDYTRRICRLFKNTRRTIMSQFVDLESSTTNLLPIGMTQSPINVPPMGEIESLQTSQNTIQTLISPTPSKRQSSARQASTTSEALINSKDIDYMENTCVPEPSSCQYRQLYDMISLYIDKITHAVSLSDCQRQCDLERLFSCKSVNYDPGTKNCMLINEDLISLNRGQQASLLPKKNTIYSEKGNCEMISVQCNSQEMLVSINFDAPFKGKVMAKGNPEQCYLVGDGQTSIKFPIVFGPKCNSRQEGHNTFVNEVVIQQHPVIMTDSDKTVRVMCAFEAPEQTITLKNPSSRDNKTGIDVGTPAESSRTRHDKQHLNPIVSSKASPPSVLLRILDPNGRDASMINLGDDLILRIQMQGNEGQNSALGIFARNLAARSSNGESLLLIDNDGCPVDHLVFPALEVDPKDGKSLFSTFKAFRFPSSGLVNFEVQIKFCPERCQPVDCNKGSKMRSYGRRKREALQEDTNPYMRTSIIQSMQRNPLDELSTVMKPGKAFQYVRELLLSPQYPTSTTVASVDQFNESQPQTETQTTRLLGEISTTTAEPFHTIDTRGESEGILQPTNEFNVDSATTTKQDLSDQIVKIDQISDAPAIGDSATEFEVNQKNPDQKFKKQMSSSGVPDLQTSFQKSILMHIDEKVVPNTAYTNDQRALNQPHVSVAPYGHYPLPDIELHHKRHNLYPLEPVLATVKPNNQELTSVGQNRDLSARDALRPNDQSRESTSVKHDQKSNESSTSDLPNLYPENHSGLEASMDISGQRDVPLRFSILVGENQSKNEGWVPSRAGQVFVMNSTNVEMDHIVIPGKDGQFEHISTSDSRTNQINTRYPGNGPHTTQSPSDTTYQPYNDVRPTIDLEIQSSLANNKENANPDQPLDTLSTNTLVTEHYNQTSSDLMHSNKDRLNESPSETAASHDCQNSDAGNSRLWTIIWAGSVVIVLNISLVIMSLILYFKKVHLSKNHSIMRATSECGTHSSTGRYNWPSVLLKSKNNLGTSLNTHEHFFCKLNSKPNSTSNHELNWPNLSSSSSHSTISSLASPLPVTSIRINQTRPSKPSFMSESDNTLRSNHRHGQRSILEMNAFEPDNAKSLHANYLNNIDDSRPETFQPLR